MITNKKVLGVVNWLAVILMEMVFVIAMTSRSIYLKTIKYAGIIVFFMLLFLLFSQVSVLQKLKNRDKYIWILLFSGLLVPINLFIVHSNWGALLTAWNILLLFYLADKIVFQKGCLYFIYGASVLNFVAWIFLFAKKHNPNYAGMVLCFLYICLMVINYYLKNRFSKKYVYEIVHSLLLFFTIYIILVYRARTSLLAILAFEVLFLLFTKGTGHKKWFSNLIIYGITFGNLIFTLIYMNLYAIIGDAKMPFFNKRIMSGRQYSWQDFWRGFLENPITGMGSDFEHAISNWSGIEAHNALLSLLAVHGLIVFVIIMIFIVKFLRKMTLDMELNSVNAICTAGIFLILVLSVFEDCLYRPGTVAILFLYAITYNSNNLLSKKGD